MYYIANIICIKPKTLTITLYLIFFPQVSEITRMFDPFKLYNMYIMNRNG